MSVEWRVEDSPHPDLVQLVRSIDGKARRAILIDREALPSVAEILQQAAKR